MDCFYGWTVLKTPDQVIVPPPTAWEDLSGNNIDGAYIGNVIYDENGFIVDKQSGISYVAIDSPLIAVNYQKDFTAEFLFSIERFASGKTNEVFGCLHPKGNLTCPSVEIFCAIGSQNNTGAPKLNKILLLCIKFCPLSR